MDPDSTGKAGNRRPLGVGWEPGAGTGAVPPAGAGTWGLTGIFGSAGSGVGSGDIPAPFLAEPLLRDCAAETRLALGFLQGLSGWPWDTSRRVFQGYKAEAP